MERSWQDHPVERTFSIVNRPESCVTTYLYIASREDLDINMEGPTMEEVTAASNEMMSGKGAFLGGGSDRAEMLMAEETETPRLLTEILKSYLRIGK